jgi:hypothetical protein
MTRKPTHLPIFTSLYWLAYNFQQEESLKGNALFTMAVINNLAVIYKQLDKARNCFQYVLSTLMLPVDCDGGEVRASQFDGFLKYASYLICQPSVAAAA